MWYKRFYENKFDSHLQPGKVYVIYGLRRTGKTSLIKKYLSDYDRKYFMSTGEDLTVREVFESQSIDRITGAFSGYDLVVIDEAQYINNVGLGLKILVDHLPDIKVIASGSSSFDLSNKLGEPLTGRQKIGVLYPLSMLEINQQFGGMDVLSKLNNYLVFGLFPETLNLENIKDKIEYLNTLRDSYLLKDLLILENIKNSSKLLKLLQLIAFQIGKEVSLNELANSLEMSKHTISRYLDLLEKAFIIKRVMGYSGNLRKEISKTHRYYFIDNGIRNALINNYNMPDNRNDVGMLWENFIFAERLKRNTYKKHFANYYFWRTYDKQEIDFVEEYSGELHGYEFKYTNRKKRVPKLWIESYKNSTFNVIHKENFLEFIT